MGTQQGLTVCVRIGTRTQHQLSVQAPYERKFHRPCIRYPSQHFGGVCQPYLHSYLIFSDLRAGEL